MYMFVFLQYYPYDFSQQRVNISNFWDITYYINMKYFYSTKWVFLFQIITNMPPMTNVPQVKKKKTIDTNYPWCTLLLFVSLLKNVLFTTWICLFFPTDSSLRFPSSEYSKHSPAKTWMWEKVFNRLIACLSRLLSPLNKNVFSYFQIPSFDANPMPSQDPLQHLQDQPPQTSQVIINLYITIHFTQSFTANECVYWKCHVIWIYI